MVPWWWSVLLMAVGVLGLFLAGSKFKLGWIISFGAQGLWIAYAITTAQWGFLLSALVYGWVYARNWLRWRREENPAYGKIDHWEPDEENQCGYVDEYEGACILRLGHSEKVPHWFSMSGNPRPDTTKED